MSHLLSESSSKTFSLIAMDCDNWGCENRRFPASDDVWPSSASELRIKARNCISRCASVVWADATRLTLKW